MSRGLPDWLYTTETQEDSTTSQSGWMKSLRPSSAAVFPRDAMVSVRSSTQPNSQSYRPTEEYLSSVRSLIDDDVSPPIPSGSSLLRSALRTSGPGAAPLTSRVAFDLPPQAIATHNVTPVLPPPSFILPKSTISVSDQQKLYELQTNQILAALAAPARNNQPRRTTLERVAAELNQAATDALLTSDEHLVAVDADAGRSGAMERFNGELWVGLRFADISTTTRPVALPEPERPTQASNLRATVGMGVDLSRFRRDIGWKF